LLGILGLVSVVLLILGLEGVGKSAEIIIDLLDLHLLVVLLLLWWWWIALSLLLLEIACECFYQAHIMLIVLLLLLWSFLLDIIIIILLLLDIQRTNQTLFFLERFTWAIILN
jgi:hypothetical protein